MTSSLPRAGPFPPWKLLKTSFAKCQHTTPSQSVGRHCALKDLSIHEPKEVDVAFRVLSLNPEQVQALSSEFEKQISQRPPDKELTHSDWLLMVSSILERCPSKFAVQGQNDEQSSNWQQLFDDSSQRRYNWNPVTKQTRWSLDLPGAPASKDANHEELGSQETAEAVNAATREFHVTGPSETSVSEPAFSPHTPQMTLGQHQIAQPPQKEVLDSDGTYSTADVQTPATPITQMDASLH